MSNSQLFSAAPAEYWQDRAQAAIAAQDFDSASDHYAEACAIFRMQGKAALAASAERMAYRCASIAEVRDIHAETQLRRYSAARPVLHVDIHA